MGGLQAVLAPVAGVMMESGRLAEDRRSKVGVGRGSKGSQGGVVGHCWHKGPVVMGPQGQRGARRVPGVGHDGVKE